jgi:TrmH family RNA methyltransferase
LQHPAASSAGIVKWQPVSNQIQLNRLCVVMVGVRNPLNIGAAARATSNFGFSSFRVVHPYEKAFREARSAVGASELLAHAEEYDNVNDAVADCSLVVGTTAAKDRELQHPIKRLEQGAKAIRKTLASGKVALLFGSERFGLLNSDLSHCHWTMRIPTREDHGSMNLGQAVAVTLYELVRDPTKTLTSRKPKIAPGSQQERVTQYFLQALRTSGYIKRGAENSAEEKLRRLVLRLALGPEDAATVQGMLRKILWKIGATR